MVILAIDVGKGTEDLMIYDEDKSFENSIQVVWPSSAQLMYKRLQNDHDGPLIFSGEIMAGEPWHKLVYEITSRYGPVYMTKQSAMSLRYNLEQVEANGVNIIDEEEAKSMSGNHYYTTDIIWERIESLLISTGLDKTDISTVLLACQDHGNPPDPSQSVKDFRMDAIYSKLDATGRIEDLLTPSTEISEYLPRHQSIAESAKLSFPHLSENDIFVMDSSPAVILGAMDVNSHELVINVGNGHTLAVIQNHGVVEAIYETHTGRITSSEFFNDIELLIGNKLSHDQAIKNGAHGVYVRSSIEKKEIRKFLPFTLIGPNRRQIDHIDAKLVHPGGSMMMSGPIGLIKSFQNYTK